jgi:hypothetical protein
LLYGLTGAGCAASCAGSFAFFLKLSTRACAQSGVAPLRAVART